MERKRRGVLHLHLLHMLLLLLLLLLQLLLMLMLELLLELLRGMLGVRVHLVLLRWWWLESRMGLGLLL